MPPAVASRPPIAVLTPLQIPELRPPPAPLDVEKRMRDVLQQHGGELHRAANALFAALNRRGLSELVRSADDRRFGLAYDHLRDTLQLLSYCSRTALGSATRTSGPFSAPPPDEQQQNRALRGVFQHVDFAERTLTSRHGSALAEQPLIARFLEAASPFLLLDWKQLESR